MSDVTYELNRKYMEKLAPWIARNLSHEQIREFNELMGEFVLNAVEIVSTDCVADYSERYDSSHFGGMNAPQVMIDKIDVLFPEDSLSRSVYLEKLNLKRNHLLGREFSFLRMREEFSISGAMRWEFSQEAPIYGSMKIKHVDHYY